MPIAVEARVSGHSAAGICILRSVFPHESAGWAGMAIASALSVNSFPCGGVYNAFHLPRNLGASHDREVFVSV
jgi:hypothetical protein